MPEPFSSLKVHSWKYIAQPFCQFLYNCATQISLPMMNWKKWEALSNNDEVGGMVRKGGRHRKRNQERR